MKHKTFPSQSIGFLEMCLESNVFLICMVTLTRLYIAIRMLQTGKRSKTLYVLNENYRNTLQITEFCNKEFGAEVYPIGISGESVLELDLETAVHQISEIKKRNPEYRVAIIHRYGLKGIKKELRKILADQDVSWKAVDVRKICVIPVEIAKGLEFEAVVVIVDRMSDNEKYVSYTRALDKLIVVRDQISTETVADKKSAK